jgi:hypothetical protein
LSPPLAGRGQPVCRRAGQSTSGDINGWGIDGTWVAVGAEGEKGTNLRTHQALRENSGSFGSKSPSPLLPNTERTRDGGPVPGWAAPRKRAVPGVRRCPRPGRARPVGPLRRVVTEECQLPLGGVAPGDATPSAACRRACVATWRGRPSGRWRRAGSFRSQLAPTPRTQAGFGAVGHGRARAVASPWQSPMYTKASASSNQEAVGLKSVSARSDSCV